MTDKKIVKKEPTPLAKPLEQGRGFSSNIPNEDLILPRIELLQALSPTCVEGKGRPGTFVNNITKEEIIKPCVIIPVKVEKSYIAWNPRNEGGGILYRTNDSNDPRVIEDTKWHGNEKPKCTSYLNFLCFIVGQELPIVVSFAMTSYQAGRKLLTMARMSGGDIFSKKYVLDCVQKTNNFGTFYVFTVNAVTGENGNTTPEERAKALQLLSIFESKDIAFEVEETVTTPKADDEF